jgi:hypothetical protein
MRPWRTYDFTVRPGHLSSPAIAILPKGTDMSGWVKIPSSDVQKILDKLGLNKLTILSEPISRILTDMLNTEQGALIDEYQYEDEYNQIYASAQAILKLAPIFTEAQAAAIQLGMATSTPRRAAAQAALQSLTDAARVFQNTHVPPRPKPKGEAHWQDDAYYLALLLQSACKKKIAVTYPDTPFVKFIEEALNLAKVNHSGRRAISEELKRRKADPWWGAVREEAIGSSSGS